MVTGLPSIDDLMQTKGSKNDDVPVVSRAKTVSSLKVTGDITSKAFGKKMDEIEKKELETQAMRFAQEIGTPHIDLKKFPVSHESLRQIPLEIAQEFGVVCFYADQNEIRLGAIDPRLEEVQKIFEDIEERRHAQGAMYVISKVSLERVLGLYSLLPTVKAITKDVEIRVEDLSRVQADVNDFKSVATLLQTETTTDIMTVLLGAALKVDASDVHVEAEEKQIVARYRIDGILHDVAALPKDSFKKLLSRIKLIAKLKINITDKPQDGRYTIKLPSGDVDVRVSTIPTVFGESIVMRLLRQNDEGISLEDLGFSAYDYELLKQEIVRPNGMIITTGPTGSGKSTTLYAILKILNKPGVKIITLEDPVEYRLEGVNQSQIDSSKGYTFAKGLRSLLRQDPDIVMVGEIRDLETSEIAIQAALTGHLMLSTLHTNSAAGAIPRFVSMGSPSYLLGPALNCVMGQRLVRRVCPSCREKVTLEGHEAHVQDQIRQLLDMMPQRLKDDLSKKELIFYRAKGCSVCSGIGYKGRIGIYEIFNVTKELEQMILSGTVSEHDIDLYVREHQMTTMAQDGILKALEGITTPDEVLRVTDK